VSALTELEAAITAVATDVGPSVVAIGRGTGTIVATDQVLTNAHNLIDREAVPVRFADGEEAEGRVVAADLEGDLAVVTVPTGERPTVTWGDDPPALGTAVLAFGPPRRGPSRVTVGFVSATEQAFRGPRDRRVHGAVEHTAPLRRGSSGGPIVDVDGRVVGIDTHRRGDGFYLAIPTSAALRDRVERLRQGEAPVRRRLGIAVAPAEVARRLRAAVGLGERDGLLVREVTEDGAAATAGVQVGDLIVTADGAALRSPDDLLAAVDAAETSLRLGLVRGAEEHTVEVRF
jgi:serine protease Do